MRKKMQKVNLPKKDLISAMEKTFPEMNKEEIEKMSREEIEKTLKEEFRRRMA